MKTNERKVLISGRHPLLKSVTQQYAALGCEVAVWQQGQPAAAVQEAAELFVAADADGPAEQADYSAVARLAGLARMLAEQPGRPVCHLLLRSQRVLRLVQAGDLSQALQGRLDIYATTMAEVWSRTIRLDYIPITAQSAQRAHLVVFGMDEAAEAVAIQAALTAHYPSYVADHRLRTRITLIAPDATARAQVLLGHYPQLFCNSFYRVVKPQGEEGRLAVADFHRPPYDGQREDFVDVEWEFVEAEPWNADLRAKLLRWADDEGQLLTVVVAHGDSDASARDRNVTEALLLPTELARHDVPIHVYTGLQDYDVTLPLVRMAKNVNYVYDCCYTENFADNKESQTSNLIPHTSNLIPHTSPILVPAEIDREARDRSWERLSAVKRLSNIYNAMTVATKMRSVGLAEDEWGLFYDIPQQDIELLAQVEHNRWSVEELILGFRPCTPEEEQQVEADISQKNVLKKRMVHYDLRAYNDLRADATGKSVKVYDRCICAALPLIAKTFSSE